MVLPLIEEVSSAIERDDLGTVAEVLAGNPYVWRQDHTALCARLNRLEIVAWVYSNGILPDDDGGIVLAVSASNGNYQTYRWAKNRDYEWHGSIAMDTRAVNGGNLDIVKAEWLPAAEQRPRSPTCFTNWAAHGNHFEVLRWLHDDQDEELCDTVVYCAVKHNNAEMLQWALSRGAPLTQEARDKAIELGNPEIIAALN